ncbi:MAG: hypothetical protein U5N85_09345 [Arcicella sp.]|nr:hypothetical protein [Arcicella sp.]
MFADEAFEDLPTYWHNTRIFGFERDGYRPILPEVNVNSVPGKTEDN